MLISFFSLCALCFLLFAIAPRINSTWKRWRGITERPRINTNIQTPMQFSTSLSSATVVDDSIEFQYEEDRFSTSVSLPLADSNINRDLDPNNGNIRNLSMNSENPSDNNIAQFESHSNIKAASLQIATKEENSFP